MKKSDHRHGTPAGYQVHYRDGEKACEPCLTAKKDQLRELEDRQPIGLVHGNWRFDPFRRVQVWVPDRTTPLDQIACPTCLARPHESCRTAAGKARHAHGDRLIPKCCVCGNELAVRKQVCDECLVEKRREVA